MATKSQKRRERRQFAASLTDDERQGLAIARYNQQVIHAPHIKKFYVSGGFRFVTGEKMRHIG